MEEKVKKLNEIYEIKCENGCNCIYGSLKTENKLKYCPICGKELTQNEYSKSHMNVWKDGKSLEVL